MTTKTNYLNITKGIKSWIFSVDHKRIAIMYLGVVLFSFFLGGMFALLLRFELLTPDKLFLTAKQYNQIFTLHGTAMVFLFIIPSSLLSSVFLSLLSLSFTLGSPSII